MDNRAEGSIKIFLRTFFVSQSQKSPKGILYCCSKVGYRKCLDKKGEYQDFPSKSFCLTVPKIFVEESFTVALFSGTGKLWIRGGEYQDFLSKHFRLTVRKFSVRESITVALISVTVKVWIERGGSFKVFRRTFSVSQCRKIS